ncbi:GIY-YIG nuclease family protein [Ferrimonas pelagia]|uniref:GIY-YIG nuclease family protein n=1 Tax=Ferrimonas pelagia TaxID=1177826 RepID=A0ABP9F4M0_9GAMM
MSATPSPPSAASSASTNWSLYLVRTRTGALYTGISTDVQRRFNEHQQGGAKAARALRGKGPLQLVYQQHIGSHSEALKKEYRLKQWNKKQKEALISGIRTLDEL